jgi:hypothetical protein
MDDEIAEVVREHGWFAASISDRERSISVGSRGDPCGRRKCLLLKMVPASCLVVGT